MRHSSLIAAAVAALFLAACSSDTPKDAGTGAPVVDAGSGSGATSTGVSGGAIDPYSLAALSDPKSAVYKRSVYFDYDQYSIKDEFRSLIDAHAKFLGKNTTQKMLIQGNTDDRGSREYNLALGQKRAEAVKKALALLGAREDQIEAVSLGKEKQRCFEANESCWAENRRADMLYSGIGEF